MSDEEPQVTQVVSLWAQRATLEELRAWCVDSFWPPWNRMAIQRRLSKKVGKRLGSLCLILSWFVICLYFRTVMAAMARFEIIFYWHCWLCMDFPWLPPHNDSKRIDVGICESLPFLHPDFKKQQFAIARWTQVDVTYDVAVVCRSWCLLRL